MYCNNCGSYISDGNKFCSNCGSPSNVGTTPQPENIGSQPNCSTSQQPATGYYQQPPTPKKKKKHILRKIIVGIICILIFLGIVDALFSSTDDKQSASSSQGQVTTQKKAETTTTTTTKEATTLSPEEYKAQCQSVSYEKIARNPDDYKGVLVKFTGKVEQVMEHSWIPNEYRISVTKGQYGIWEDVVYVSYSLPEGSSRILEGDIVSFYGECEGTTSYLSILGQTVTIPSVNAEIIEISN